MSEIKSGRFIKWFEMRLSKKKNNPKKLKVSLLSISDNDVIVYSAAVFF